MMQGRTMVLILGAVAFSVTGQLFLKSGAGRLAGGSLQFYTDMGAWSGECIMQSDTPQIEAAPTIATRRWISPISQASPSASVEMIPANPFRIDPEKKRSRLSRRLETATDAPFSRSNSTAPQVGCGGC